MLRTLLLLLVLMTSFAPILAADNAGQTAKKLDTTVRVEMSYLLYLPKDYDQKESWPLLVFLHGSGERGDDLELVKTHGPPKLIAEGKEFPFIVVSPQCPKDRTWEPIELNALLDDLTKSYKVDPDRICITGLSMGGFGTWELLARYPEFWAAAVPICGGCKVDTVEKFKQVPIWVFHGAKDPTVKLKASEEMVEALKAAGGKPKFTIYPEEGHASWVSAYNDKELWTWLLAQKKPAAK